MYTDDSQKATQWLRAVAPEGFINIVTATANFTNIKTRTFVDEEAMQGWIEAEHAKHRGVFWQPNECDDRGYTKEVTRDDGSIGTVGARPTKDDVMSIRVLHLDLDFKDYFGENRQVSQAERDELYQRVKAGKGLGPNGEDVPPTHIVFSGGGFHAYWVLAEPLPKTDATTARVESINANIATTFRAEPGTKDISRLLRVPGTTNFVNDKKRKAGRTDAAVSAVLDNPEARYTLDDFGGSTEKLPLDKPKSNELTGTATKVTDLTKLGLTVEQDHDTIALIIWAPDYGTGFERPPELHNDEAEKYFSDGERSERVLSVVSRLAKRKVPVDDIVGVLLNPDWGVSAHVLDQKNPEAYAWHQCRHIGEPVVISGLVSLAPIPVDLKPPPIYVPGWLYERKVSVLAGRGGVGKSLLALQLGASCALGKPMLGFRPKDARKVLILNSEDDTDMLRYRLWAICEEHGIDHRELEGKLYSMPLVSVELIVKTETEDGIKFVKTPLYERILRHCDEHDIDVLIADPFGETFENCDESSNSDMLKVIVEHRKALAEAKQDLCLLICHHTRKGYTQEGSEQDAIRGGGAIVNAARFGQVLEPLTSEDAKNAIGDAGDRRFVKLIDAKRNYTKKEGDMIFEFKAHTHPSGFSVAAFVVPDLTVFDANTPIALWTHTETVKAEVRRRYNTRPFSNASRGAKDHRFEVWLQETFKLSKPDTKTVSAKLFQERVLTTASWKDANSDTRTVVAVEGDELPKTMEALPF